MKLVKRFDGKIEQCDNGGYVSFADYKKLESRLENAAGRERRLEARVKELEKDRDGWKSQFEEISGWYADALKSQAELERLKAQEPVAYTDAEELETMRNGTYADMFTPCEAYKLDPQWIPLFTRPAAAVPVKVPVDDLYRIASHIAGAKGGLPDEWQDWAEEIEADIRKAAGAEVKS